MVFRRIRELLFQRFLLPIFWWLCRHVLPIQQLGLEDEKNECLFYCIHLLVLAHLCLFPSFFRHDEFVNSCFKDSCSLFSGGYVDMYYQYSS